MLTAFYKELDWPKLEQKSGEFAKFLWDNHATIPLVVNPIYFGISKNVGQWPMTPGTNFGHNYEAITHGE